MQCPKCMFHFCWQCMGRFGHGEKGGNDGYENHKCNGYFREDEDVLKKQEELKRFEFYADRYNNHVKSMKIESKLLLSADTLAYQMIDLIGISSIAAQFYKDAALQLAENRRTLQNSYIFGYFRPLECPYVNKMIFENLQLELERHTEQLSGLLEECYGSPQLAFDKQQHVTHSFHIAKSVRLALLNAAMNEWVADVEEKKTSPIKKEVRRTTKRPNNEDIKKETKKRRTTKDPEPEPEPEKEKEKEKEKQKEKQKEKLKHKQKAKPKETVTKKKKTSKDREEERDFEDDGLSQEDMDLQLAIQASLNY